MSENKRTTKPAHETGGPMRGPGPRPGRGPGGHMGAMMKGDKAQDFKGTMSKLLAYLGSYNVGILVVMVFAIASTVFTIIGPKILGRATTKLFEGVMAMIAGTGDGIDFDFIGRIILITIGLYLTSTIFSYIQGWIMSGIAVDITYRFRKDIVKKINSMPF